jgi:hypothetical protein
MIKILKIKVKIGSLKVQNASGKKLALVRANMWSEASSSENYTLKSNEMNKMKNNKRTY